MDNFNLLIDEVEQTFLILDDISKVTAFQKLHLLLSKLESPLIGPEVESGNITKDGCSIETRSRVSKEALDQMDGQANGLADGVIPRQNQNSPYQMTGSRGKIKNKPNNTKEHIPDVTREQSVVASDTSDPRTMTGLVSINATKNYTKSTEKIPQTVRRGNRKRKVTAKLLESVSESKDNHSDAEDGSDLNGQVQDMVADDDNDVYDQPNLVVDTTINVKDENGRKRKVNRPLNSARNQLGLPTPKKKIIRSHKFFNTNNIKKKYTKNPDATKMCNECKEIFQRGSPFQKHLESHGDAPVCCKHCRNEFSNPVSLTHHQCPHLTEKNRKGPKLCRVCGEEFHTVRDLHCHMRSDHNLKSREPSFFCKFCRRGFVKKVSMYSHYKDHAKVNQMVCFKCGTFCNSFEEYSNHMEEHSKDANYKCEKCSAAFSNLRNYQIHMAGHDKYKCTDCDQSYASRKRLELHCRNAHGTKMKWESKVFECLYCHKKFGRPGQMEVHLRIHTGERPIECRVCNMFFRTSKALFKHRNTRTHLTKSGQSTKDKTFLCNECGRSYYRKQALQRHMKYHVDDDKPHVCPHCGYRCRESNNLKRHISLHFVGERNFVCEVCGSSFHAKKTLEMHHSYKHSSERNFTCKLCPLSFKAANALNRHMKTHSDVKDQKCWCGTSFKRRYNLRRHMRQVHGTDETLPPPRRLKILDQENKHEHILESGSMAPEPRELAANQSDANTYPLTNSEENQMTQQELFNEAARKAIQTAVSSSPSHHPDTADDSSNLDQMNSGIQEILFHHIQVPTDMSAKQIADNHKHFTQLVPVSKESVVQTVDKESLVRYYVGQQQSSLPVCRDHCYYNGPDSNTLYSGGILTEAVRSSSVIMAKREVASSSSSSSEANVPTGVTPTVTALLGQSVDGSPHGALQNTSMQQFGGFYVGLIPQLHSYSVSSPTDMKLDNLTHGPTSEQREHTVDASTQQRCSPHSNVEDNINSS